MFEQSGERVGTMFFEVTATINLSDNTEIEEEYRGYSLDKIANEIAIEYPKATSVVLVYCIPHRNITTS